MGLFGGDVAGRIASRLLQDEGIDDNDEELYAVSVRLPLSTKAMLDALAEHAGVSRNAMAIDLVSAGIEDVFGRLPDSVADHLRESAFGRM